MPDKKDYQLEFYAYQVVGTDVCHDPALKQPLTQPDELKEGFRYWCMGPAGEPREVKVTRVHGPSWRGESHGMIVSGSFQENRFPNPEEGSELTFGGWAAEVFGDTSRLVTADFR